MTTCDTSDNTGCLNNETGISLGGGTGYQLVCAQSVIDFSGTGTFAAVATCPRERSRSVVRCKSPPRLHRETTNAKGEIAHLNDAAAVGCEAELDVTGNATVQACVTCETAPNQKH